MADSSKNPLPADWASLKRHYTTSELIGLMTEKQRQIYAVDCAENWIKEVLRSAESISKISLKEMDSQLTQQVESKISEAANPAVQEKLKEVLAQISSRSHDQEQERQHQETALNEVAIARAMLDLLGKARALFESGTYTRHAKGMTRKARFLADQAYALWFDKEYIAIAGAAVTAGCAGNAEQLHGAFRWANIESQLDYQRQRAYEILEGTSTSEMTTTPQTDN